MDAHKAACAAHEELVDGLRSISTGNSSSSDGAVLVELRQSFGVGLQDEARIVLGSMQTQTFNAGGLGENKVVRVLFVDMFFPALQQHHTRLLALVEAESSLMPHLLIEVIATKDVSTAVHVDFITSIGPSSLPKEYDAAQKLFQAQAARERVAEHLSAGGLSSGGDALAPDVSIVGAVVGPCLRAMVGEWMYINNLPLRLPDELHEDLWARERQLDLALLNPRDDPLAARLLAHCGPDVLSLASALGEEHSSPALTDGGGLAQQYVCQSMTDGGRRSSVKLSALGEEHSVASNLWSLARFTLGTSLDDPTPGLHMPLLRGWPSHADPPRFVSEIHHAPNLGAD
ncbi:hypothetical protein T484DRAFT_1769552 [Baffinella frigidus]|nr:hypothetical protein T484DRAFT_1769552 [Cryptophyta sp. CCMP2293]